MRYSTLKLALVAFLAALALGCGSGDSACEGDAPDDGCNSCQCVCEGGACSWECTLMACLDVAADVAPDVVDAADDVVPLTGDLRVVLKNGTLDPITGNVEIAFVPRQL